MAGATRRAHTAVVIGLNTDPVADGKLGHAGAQLADHARELMPKDLRPGVVGQRMWCVARGCPQPHLEQLQVRSADAVVGNLNLDLPVAGGRVGDVFQPEVTNVMKHCGEHPAILTRRPLSPR